MKQLVAIVAVCRLAILKRMPATPLTLLREQSASPEKWKDEDLGCSGSRSCLFKPE